ncbi:MAG: winged helix-turn-helix domain-containing protein, partial [Acidobacteria bacterium]|nr:winged helix-turn-helix domain-containing protein [Acidobacteriota bacterium]
MKRLTLDEARRVALTAQGFGRRQSLEEAVLRIGLLQIDFVNVLIPAHFLIPFSRIGPYDRAQLHSLVYRKYRFTEQWAHEASIVPVEHWPLLQHRRAAHRVRPYGFDSVLRKHAGYAEWVLEQIRARGPLAAEDLEPPPGVARKLHAVWMGMFPRAVLEAHFGRGLIACANRLPNYARSYDLPERIVPREYLETSIPVREQQHGLLRIAAAAHGVGTARDLADYHRMNIRDARERLREMTAAGELEEVIVDGWREPAFLPAGARIPHAHRGAALLSPFDPLVWFRPRAERLFGFEYRIEIYTPAAKRRWGYYVLPFLLNGQLVARVDLKADR